MSHTPHICLAGGTALARLQVHGLHATPVGGKVGNPILEGKVTSGVAGPHLKIAWDGRHRPEDQVPWDLDDLRIVIHLGAVVVKNRQGFLRGELDPHFLQNVERGFLHDVQLLVA